MIAMPFHPSNVYTIEELKANLDDILNDVEKKAAISLDGKVPFTLKNKVHDGKLLGDVEVQVDEGGALAVLGGAADGQQRGKGGADVGTQNDGDGAATVSYTHLDVYKRQASPSTAF